MEFSAATLRSTFERFIQVLDERSLGLSRSAARHVWANIVLGRNYSAASYMASTHGTVLASPLTEERVQKALHHRSRIVDSTTARSILIDTFKDELCEVSLALSKLSDFVQSREGMCLIEAATDYYGFGLIDSEHAGYIGLSKCPWFKLSDIERTWCRESSSIVTGLVNAAAGIGRDAHNIHIANIRLQFKKADDVFAEFCREEVDKLCSGIAEGLLAKYPVEQIGEWGVVGFDDVYYMVYDVFETAILDGRRGWLKIDCDLAETVINHVSVQVRKTLKWMSESEDEEAAADPVGTLVSSTKLAMKNVLKMQ